MAWITPIWDRTIDDSVYARRYQENATNNKGALNYKDLNRIEGNHRMLMIWLEDDGYYLPHSYRNYTETFNGKKYTNWQEINIPWLSEINRIRGNYNALVQLMLVNLNLPIFSFSNYLDYAEVNNWEKVASVGKKMFENMEQTYILCGTERCSGDLIDCCPYDKNPSFSSLIGYGVIGKMIIGYR